MSPQSMAGVRWNLTTHTASLQEPQAWLGPATMGMPIPPTRPTDALLAREVHSRGPAACQNRWLRLTLLIGWGLWVPHRV